jgi:hypothetical protein
MRDWIRVLSVPVIVIVIAALIILVVTRVGRTTYQDAVIADKQVLGTGDRTDSLIVKVAYKGQIRIFWARTPTLFVGLEVGDHCTLDTVAYDDGSEAITRATCWRPAQ